MKRVLVKSVYDAFEYVMQHFYCFGQADMAERKDTYAVNSDFSFARTSSARVF